MKVFLDTNILIDLSDSRDNAYYTETILNLGKGGKIQTCVSYLSYANINYIKRKTPRFERYQFIRRLRQGITVLPCNFTQIFYHVLNLLNPHRLTLPKFRESYVKSVENLR